MKEINDISVQEESLKNAAREMGEDYDSILLMYFQERLLHRLSISGYRDNFLLKGDLLLYALHNSNKKGIKSMEFLANQITNNTQSIKNAFEKICSKSVDEDNVDFDEEGIIAEPCTIEDKNRGICIKIPATFNGRKEIIQLVISFGEVIIPKPQNVQYPVLLNTETPFIRTYSTESIVAEKFESIISCPFTKNSLINLYDLNILLETHDFDGRILLEAIFETFQRRGTILEKEHPLFSKSYREDGARINQWENLLNRIGNVGNIEFPQVVEHISKFLKPIYQTILQENEYFKTWNSQNQKWN
ncbi:nucleotidyl transferase AbiEii/AbiGii toxin family protein [Oceanobacillus sp. CF4.6]|uniref:nucleotidyl transferase AbiEii/AbiGii toxin family protein n=1 Tax=Oceanobacillus sp. CF4.6 TaxID=3373080 RepID=UPI003EE6B902